MGFINEGERSGNYRPLDTGFSDYQLPSSVASFERGGFALPVHKVARRCGHGLSILNLSGRQSWARGQLIDDEDLPELISWHPHQVVFAVTPDWGERKE